MIDLSTDRVVLLKAVRRKKFTLERDPALTTREVVQMTDGSVWSIAYRRPEYWYHNPRTPLAVAFRMRGGFDDGVAFVRHMDAANITGEMAEVSA
ncbi:MULTISPECIES: hypothetical protein [Streptomyces]|uniref:Uncharacterized protein n=2 Tax=Streptomyces TaxID=1883 RepID=A0ABV9IVU5_9ACTN